ncbi:MAG: RNA polymerase sigma-70 factor [Prevotella sp.]|nr:RNA polymerase sigma-70 factor [Prevotella sp.]
MATIIRIDKQTAFERCFRDNYQPLCYFAASKLGDDVAAEDVVQEVFVRLLKGDHQFDSEVRLRNFLYTAVHNQCIDRLRHQQRVVAVPVEQANSQFDDETEARIVRAELLRQIADAISQLSERQRDVFRLAYIEDKGNAEIAELLGMQVNTVKVQKQRAKQRLRELLGDVYPLLFLFLHHL